MQNSVWILGLGWLAVALTMTVLWVYQQARRNATIVDVAWSAGVGLMALAFAYFGEGSTLNRVLLAAIAGTWSLRLFLYLLITRVLRHEEEDGRYAEMRTRWGSRASFNFFLFFQFQAFLVVLFAVAFVPVANNPSTHWSAWTSAAVALALAAILGEAIADAQLAAWRKDPAHRGQTCRAGLWAYSRHPNYFFEWIHWWAYVCLAIGSQIPWLALWGPMIMLLFLFRITGIPYTEQQALRSRADYAEYQRTVSVFIPWFPSK